MTDLSDVNMEGVRPMSDIQELPVGQYLVRIEDTEKKETKERFDEQGNKLAPNHYLQISLKVYGGTNDGQVEFSRLNLWNTNETAVNMAKAELKSIQNATGVASASSIDMHGKWMVLEVKAGIKDPTKLYKHYHKADESFIEPFKDVPAVAIKSKAPPFVASNPKAASVAASPAGSSDVPAWARKA